MTTPTARQPLEAAHIPDALLSIETVSALTGWSRSTIYRQVAAGAFPQPRKLGPRCTRWRAGDVMGWLADSAAAADRR